MDYGNKNTLGDSNTLGNKNTLGDSNTLGNRNTLGNDNTLGNWNTLGNCLRYGERLTVAGVKVRRLMTMANVDGSGRQVLVLAHTEGVKIECGCFSGTLDEFCARADSEGKKRYSRVVRAAVEAFVACLDEDGITGGWEN